MNKVQYKNTLLSLVQFCSHQGIKRKCDVIIILNIYVFILVSIANLNKRSNRVLTAVEYEFKGSQCISRLCSYTENVQHFYIFPSQCIIGFVEYLCFCYDRKGYVLLRASHSIPLLHSNII